MIICDFFFDNRQTSAYLVERTGLIEISVSPVRSTKLLSQTEIQKRHMNFVQNIKK